jgi:hypothetical protein
MAKLVQFINIIGLISLAACENRLVGGKLRVNALTPGEFDIYRMEGDPPAQFVSESVGKFNEDLALDPGSYLVLADCSFEKIFVKTGETLTLTANKVLFKPAQKASQDDNFLVQCSRFEQFQFRQNLVNHFDFDVLGGSRELLVGMKPFTLDFSEKKSNAEPQQITIELSALRVTSPDPETTAPEVRYFVTPAESLISVTQPQEFSHWQFLLPGRYDVEVNGTHKFVSLTAGENLSLDSANIRLNAPKDISLDEGTRIMGSPVSATINGTHLLSFNDIIPVLPGPATIQISGSQKVVDIIPEEGKLIELNLRSLKIELGCSPWEWTCLGSQVVQLFDGEQHYPYMEAPTDVQILFLEADVYAGLLTSSGLRYKLPPDTQNFRLQAGKVKLVPKPVYRPGQITDLVRIESSNKLVSGHSRDIAAFGPTSVLLIAGEYRLAQYHSSTTVEGERSMKTVDFVATPGETITIEFPFYVTEHSLKKISLANARHDESGTTARAGIFRKVKRARSF